MLPQPAFNMEDMRLRLKASASTKYKGNPHSSAQDILAGLEGQRGGSRGTGGGGSGGKRRRSSKVSFAE